MRNTHFILSILLFATFTESLTAQVKGNKQIITQTFDISGLTDLEAAIYANVTIDANGDDIMTITTDQNILPLIDTEMVNGKIILRQKEWIQGSQRIKIKVSSSSLQRVQQSVHDNLKVTNLDQKEFRAMAILGKITLSGKVGTLRAAGEEGDISINDLEVAKIEQNFWGDGGLIQNETKDSFKSVRNENLRQVKNNSANWIDLKIKNNSAKRINAYVRGPKPNGKSFSYGFPMGAGQTRKERWTVGTKVYKMSKLGLKKVLVELTEEDDGKLVNLYQ